MTRLVVEEFRLEDIAVGLLDEIATFQTAFWGEVLPDDPPVSPAAARASLLAGPTDHDMVHLVARLDGELAGTGGAAIAPTEPNSAVAQCSLAVGPHHRRKGVGTALLRELVRQASARGCTSIVPWGLRTPVSMSFWDAFALAEVQTSRRSRVRVADIDASLMETWRTSSSAADRGYTLRSFVGRCPDDLLDAYVDGQTGLHDAPSDDLDLAPLALGPQQIRELEAVNEERGIRHHVVLALDPDGQAAGLTEIAVADYAPHLISQQVTATLAAHRRQGIGRWLKAAMYHHIVDELPGATLIETGNADSNAPMLSLNDAMGFVPVLEYTVRQGDVSAVIDALAR